jgi:predicted DNA-binding antitoxin AbrB/MazE fold protein
MTYQVDAIYDNGVLRPLAPLALADQAQVKLTIVASEPPASAQDVIASQKAALEELDRAIQALPRTGRNDNWSVRRHDELLYGGAE